MSGHRSNTSQLPWNVSHMGWQGLLQDADSADGVVRLARDYLADWTPEEIAELPPALRPGKVVDEVDVSLYAFNLVSAEQQADCPPLVHKMAAFFGSASHRLGELLAHKDEVT